MKKEISLGAVIGLQEISNEWAGKLSAFFSQHQYHFFTALYGRQFNGFMGVGIAVPYEKYDVLDVDFCTLGALLPMPKKSPPGFLTGLFEKCFGGPQKLSSWEAANQRNNRMVSVVLKPRGEGNCQETVTEKSTASAFSVSTYHMPCAFRDPQMMVLHCALASQRARSVAEKAGGGKCLPYTLIGDFNIKPKSTMYRILTEGDINEPSNPEIPVVPQECNWNMNITPMQSAYYEASRNMKGAGEEPNFTNYAMTASDSEPFIDTLDYIFLSKEWNVKSVENLPHRDDVDGPLPTRDEPSDHILLSATISLD